MKITNVSDLKNVDTYYSLRTNNDMFFSCMYKPQV